ncbi:nicotinate-nucleotide--dimethylbenzimidazole phosphoribosyltransferase [Megalodesulfovibrio gigas]|uniref:Nicotinate-nucleotide--dimethylbenzimidazole phosphoribosyltransferase n=1 Tax=Megalodesulfovibrio gigas (strain ATCC 19364 / DSM 1382 / NCIMB 9332 / VKM B-1759) TaxID=1121448 RepID=T2G7W5_MEGG1|nr:nicotinate-nucleotide--dimethylbenzimidazole phosphoribosyltransferase [Megalodesulfovibrio gigas]AGW12279.1 putative Nicotinate-nucleotide--dimethylbenzimidazole phosphoribosyltransferase [Megalodesulfovibrio gigas DSM 1382 = ATCC 19364]
MSDLLQQAVAGVTVPDPSLRPLAQARLDSLTKPQGSLGRLEEMAALLFRLQGGVLPVQVDPVRCLVMAGDHGVAGPDGPGVSLFPQAVTRQMVQNFVNGGAGVNVLCRSAGVALQVVDIGCAGGEFPPHPTLVQRKVAPGTANFLDGPAMTRAQCQRALEVGIELAQEAAAAGVRTLCLGEMGIGNTTAASALFAAFLGLDPAGVVGPGTGLSAYGIEKKIDVVRQALACHADVLRAGEPLGILAALGGLEIAGMAGLVLGGAASGMLVVVDGFIATAAYVAAQAFQPLVREYAIFAHASAEPGHQAIMQCIGGAPLLHLGMRLGEGTGAVLCCQVLRAAAAVINEMATFESAGVSGASG